VTGLPLVVLANVQEEALGLHLAGIDCVHSLILPPTPTDGTMSSSDRHIPLTSFR
jgi:hypothetical protein